MGNAQARAQDMIEPIKHPGAKQFLQTLLEVAKEKDLRKVTTPVLRRKGTTTIMPKKRKADTILDEVVQCIHAQNPKKSHFGLFICERHLPDSSIDAFCTVLATNESLASLSLIQCKISANGLEFLGKCLEKNKSIISLNFSCCILDSKGLTIFLESLQHHPQLVELFLDQTEIDDESVRVLSETILNTTKTLRIVDLSRNKITPTGYKYLLSALESNMYLTDIRVKGNPGLSSEQIQTIENLSRRNDTVNFIMEKILRNTFIQISIKIRAQQTMQVRGNVGNSPARGRARGGTIDMALLPRDSPISEVPLQDFGNSPSSRYDIGWAHTIGRRKDMQDALLVQGQFGGCENQDLICIFDGHGSDESANFAAKNLPGILLSKMENLDIVQSLRETFLELDRQIKPFAINQGTTAVVCLIKDHILYVANVGDSRAVLCRGNRAIRLTHDHKPESPFEKQRIEKLGGFIRNGRVQGALAISRAFGDSFAGNLVSAEPYISVTHLTREDEFLIVACDGLFDIFMDNVAVEIARGVGNSSAAATKLKDQAFVSGSTDNISVIVVPFAQHHRGIDPSPAHEPVIISDQWEPYTLDSEPASETNLNPVQETLAQA